MGKRKAREEPVDEAERVRRERQRELREAAVAARAAGDVFQREEGDEKKKRKPQAARKELARKEKRRQEAAASRRAIQKEVKKQRAAAPDVVIVPIYWKGEAKQMARVVSCCADVEAALSGLGKKILLDAGHKYTPGQKFAHWEHKGVRLRIEVGPREAERGHCTVARTFTPGEPAHRATKIPISAEALKAELARMSDMAAPAGEDADGAAEPVEQEAVASDDDEEAAPARAQRQLADGRRRTDDDLDDDWVTEAPAAADDDDDDEEEEEEEDDEDDDEPSVAAPKRKKEAGVPTANGKALKGKALPKGGRTKMVNF